MMEETHRQVPATLITHQGTRAYPPWLAPSAPKDLPAVTRLDSPGKGPRK